LLFRRADRTKYGARRAEVTDKFEIEQQERRDRERVLELLLSKEQVVALIYAKSGATATNAVPLSPTKTNAAVGYGMTGSPTAGMDGVVNGLLDLNFGSNPSWASGGSVNGDNVQGESDTAREESLMDKLPPLIPPSRK
jgi:hypothetical protein